MALSTSEPRETEEQVRGRFMIAQQGRPSDEQLAEQKALKGHIADIAALINRDIADSREKSLALTHLEEALMWAGKAIFS